MTGGLGYGNGVIVLVIEFMENNVIGAHNFPLLQ